MPEPGRNHSLRGREPRTDTGWGRGKGIAVSETEENPQGEATPAGEGAAQSPAIEGSGLTQEQINALVGNARKKERAKAAEAIEAANAEVEAAKEREAQAQARIDEMQGRIDAMEHERQVAEWAAQAAAETGVPASVLKGDTLEELQAHAAQIRAAMPAYPVLSADAGEADAPAVTKDDLYAIKDRRARIMAMGQHPEAFE